MKESPLIEVWSGGQTGLDRAGWLAAKAAGLPTNGFLPARFRAEDGYHPEYATLFGAREHESPEFPPRTRANILSTDATLVLGLARPTPGTRLTLRLCEELGRPLCWIPIERDRTGVGAGPRHGSGSWRVVTGAWTPQAVAEWIVQEEIKRLNVAGVSESKALGVQAWATGWLGEVFAVLKERG